MYYPMWPYEGLYDPFDPKDPDAMRDAITYAVSKNDIDAVRDLFDRAFWQNVTPQPDWFHLYVAAQQQNRKMVQLLLTHGATWTPEQAKAAVASLGEKLDGMHCLLHNAGIRTDFTAADLKTADTLTALQMDHRVLHENARAKFDVTAARKQFDKNLDVALVNAAFKNDAPLIRAIVALREDNGQRGGIDITTAFDLALGDFITAQSSQALRFVDNLRAAHIKMQPIQLHRLSGTKLSGHYDLITALDDRRLLGGSQEQLRDGMFRSWTYLQEQLDLDGYVLKLSPDMIAEKHKQFSEAAAILCTAKTPLGTQEADSFVSLNRLRHTKNGEALTRMNTALVDKGFFDNPAFDTGHMRALAATSLDQPQLLKTFNLLAQKKEIENDDIDHFLHPKRFGTLTKAMESGAWKPDSVDTRSIVDYLARQVRKDEVPEETLSTLRLLRDKEVDTRLLDPLRYVGRHKPGLAKTLLDMDLVTARQFNVAKLRKQMPSHTIHDILSQRKDREYEMREFLYQVMLERSNPATYKPKRAESAFSYQRHYFLDMMNRIRTGQRPQR